MTVDDHDRSEHGEQPVVDNEINRAHKTIKAEIDCVQAKLSDIEAEHPADREIEAKIEAHRHRLTALLSVAAQLDLLGEPVVHDLTARVRNTLAPETFTDGSGGEEIVRLCREADVATLESLQEELDAYFEISAGENEVIEELLGSTDVEIWEQKFDEAEIDLTSDQLEEREFDIEPDLTGEEDSVDHIGSLCEVLDSARVAERIDLCHLVVDCVDVRFRFRWERVTAFTGRL